MSGQNIKFCTDIVYIIFNHLKIGGAILEFTPVLKWKTTDGIP